MFFIDWRMQYQEPTRDELLGMVTAVDCSLEPDLTIQSGKDDADINVLMRRFGVTGNLPVAALEPFYGDFSEATDYQESLNRVIAAQEAFEALPSSVRHRFGGHPANLIEFLERADRDEETRLEAVKLGLLKARAPVPLPVAEKDPLVSEDPAAL